MKKGRKIATRNNLSIYYSEDNGYSVFTPDGKCLSKGYFYIANAERFCLNNTDYVKKPRKYKCKYDTSKPCENHDTSSMACVDCILNKIRKEVVHAFTFDTVSGVELDTNDYKSIVLGIVDKYRKESSKE